MQGCIVEPELVQGFAKILVVLRIDREHAGEYARLHLLESWQCRDARLSVQGQRVADRRAIDFLDACDQEADLARAEPLSLRHLRRKAAHLVRVMAAAGGHHPDSGAFLQDAINHSHERHDADIVVEPGIDDQRLQRRCRIALRRRNAGDDRIQHILDPFAGLGAGQHRILRLDADDFLDLVLHAPRLGRRQVDLVDDRNYLEAGLDSGVTVRDALRLHALRCIHDQDSALAGRQRARYFIGKVYMPGRIDEIQLVIPTIPGAVSQRDRLRLDRDAALPLDVHRVEYLCRHFAIGEAAADLDEPVRERRLAVIDMSDDGKIADMVHGGHAAGRLHAGSALYRAGRLRERGFQAPASEPSAAPSRLASSTCLQTTSSSRHSTGTSGPNRLISRGSSSISTRASRTSGPALRRTAASIWSQSEQSRRV
jgi:hypothetical protein